MAQSKTASHVWGSLARWRLLSSFLCTHFVQVSARLRDVILLMKPRILVLLVITCAGSMVVAAKAGGFVFSWVQMVWTCLGLALSAGGANTVNMWYDRDIDCVMERTKKRPIPMGRMHAACVLPLGIFWGLVGCSLLWVRVNGVAAMAAAAGFLFYTLIYTMLLKRNTVQNIVIGGAAGAFPPVVGWAAVQGDVASWLPWALFCIIFFWTPPHFWALALRRCDDYTKAGVPMMPVVRGSEETRAQMLYYMLLLVPVVLSVGFFEPFGFLYLVAAVTLSGVWIYQLVRLLYAADEKTMRFWAGKVFGFSLIYLAVLFAVMVVDALI